MTKKEKNSDMWMPISAILLVSLIITASSLAMMNSDFKDYKQKHPENSIGFQCDVEMQDFIDLRKQNENLQEQLSQKDLNHQLSQIELSSINNSLTLCEQHLKTYQTPDAEDVIQEQMAFFLRNFADADELNIDVCIENKNDVSGCFYYDQKNDKYVFRGNVAGNISEGSKIKGKVSGKGVIKND